MPKMQIDFLTDQQKIDYNFNTGELCVDTPVTEDVSLRVHKTAELIGGNTIDDIIEYTIEVENTGNVTLNLKVNEDLFGGESRTVWDIEDELEDGFGTVIHDGRIYEDSALTENESQDIYDFQLFAFEDENTPTEGTLGPGKSAKFKFKYQIKEQDASSGLVSNRAKVNALGPLPTQTPVYDYSEDKESSFYDENINQDNYTVTTLSAIKSMKVTKTVVGQDIYPSPNGDGVIESNDKLVYTITVKNDGQVNLYGLVLEDNIYDDDTQSDGLIASTNDGGLQILHAYGNGQINLPVGETKTFSVEYIIQEGVFNSGVSTIYNEVKVSAKSTGSTTFDVIEFGDKAEGGGPNDRTDYSFSIDPSVEATKIGQYVDFNNNGLPDATDRIVYSITIENTGNVRLFDMSIVDVMNYSGVNNNIIPTPPDLIFIESTISNRTESDIKSTDENNVTLYNLLVGETLTFESTYILESDDFSNAAFENNQKFIENQITVDGSYSDVNGNSQGFPTEVSDNGDDTDGGISSDKTKIFISEEPSLKITKEASSYNSPELGDIISFEIIVENDGNTKIDGYTVKDDLTALGTSLSLTPGSGGLSVQYKGIIEPNVLGPLSGIKYDNDGNAIGYILNIGEKAKFEASYQISQDAVDGGGINNRFTATTPSPDSVDFISDDINQLGTPGDQPTSVTIDQNLDLRVIKTVELIDDNGNDKADIGEKLLYRIDLENIGNVTIYKPASGFFNDSMTLRECPEDSDCPDLEYDNNNEIEYIEDFNSLNNIIDTDGLKIFPGYTAKYEALLTVNQAMIDYGGVKNILDVTYVDILGQSKNIKSIDNDEFDNEDETEDYTEFIIDVSPDLEITKYLMVEAEDNTPIEIDVTVQGGVFKYSILDGDDVEQDVTSTLTLERGKTYRFNQDDPSNLGNQIYFSLEEDGNSYQYGVGSLDGSGEYTGLPSGTAGNNFAHTLLTVDPINQSGLISNAPISAIYTASTTQNGMGKLINIKQPEIDVSLDDELTYYIKVENTGNAILDVPNPPVDTITSNGTPLSLDDGYPLFLRKFATTSNTSQTRLIPW